MYDGNILRVVPELVYSPYATEAHLAATGTKAKPWRIDLVLFLNGIPIVTMELKSEFKQAVDNAIKQYKRTRLPKTPRPTSPSRCSPSSGARWFTLPSANTKPT